MSYKHSGGQTKCYPLKCVRMIQPVYAYVCVYLMMLLHLWTEVSSMYWMCKVNGTFCITLVLVENEMDFVFARKVEIDK